MLALSSVGGLRGELGVGTFVAPDDFIALDTVISAYDDERAHIVPTFDGEWRTVVIGAVHEHASVPLHNGGVYWQVSGPRFETPRRDPVDLTLRRRRRHDGRVREHRRAAARPVATQ